jgi:hypothetical protein
MRECASSPRATGVALIPIALRSMRSISLLVRLALSPAVFPCRASLPLAVLCRWFAATASAPLSLRARVSGVDAATSATRWRRADTDRPRPPCACFCSLSSLLFSSPVSRALVPQRARRPTASRYSKQHSTTQHTHTRTGTHTSQNEWTTDRRSATVWARGTLVLSRTTVHSAPRFVCAILAVGGCAGHVALDCL